MIADIIPADAWDVERLRRYIGREATATDHVTPLIARQLLDVIGIEEEIVDGGPAPLGIQWCLARPDVPLSGLQDDGHPQAVHTILPPVPSARRMWAGGEIVSHDPLRIGDEVTRRSVIADVSMKVGTSGMLCFVTVRHDYSTERGPAIAERQDIVYRQADAPGGAPRRTLPAGNVYRRITTDPVRLFRYSALTGNAHRIHYDRLYATGVEDYRDLVVHGPLQATMLMQAAAMLAGRTSCFAYRAVSPMFCGEEIVLYYRGTALWTADRDGLVGMRADVVLERA